MPLFGRCVFQLVSLLSSCCQFLRKLIATVRHCFVAMSKSSLIYMLLFCYDIPIEVVGGRGDWRRGEGVVLLCHPNIHYVFLQHLRAGLNQ